MSIAAFQAVDPVLIPSQLRGPTLGFPCSSAGRESACNVGDLGLLSGLGGSPGEGWEGRKTMLRFGFEDNGNSK